VQRHSRRVLSLAIYGLCLALLIVLSSCDTSNQPFNPRFNQVRQRHSHNSYDKRENLMDQLTFHRIRAIELDLHWDAPPGDWSVYHDDPSETNCRYLSRCLFVLERFHNIDANHEPVTVFLDLKDPLDSAGGPHDLQKLEAAFGSILGDAHIFRPSEMLSGCSGASNLHQAAQRCGWPTVNELKGKFLIVGPASANIFGIANLCGPVDENASWALFYNIDASQEDDSGQSCAHWALDVWNKGYIARTWGSDAYWGQYNIQMPSTDQISGTTLRPRITDTNGYPFTSLVVEPSPPSPTGFITLTATTGTMSETRGDNILFAYDSFPGGNALTANLSTSGSVDTLGGACLMVRHDLSPGSPYVAVCSSLEDSYVGPDAPGSTKIFYRDQPGATSANDTTADYHEGDYFSLGVRPGDGQCPGRYIDLFTTEDGIWRGAADRVWSHCAQFTLDFQGISASTWGQTNVRFVFQGTRHQGFSKDGTVCAQGSGLLTSCWAGLTLIGAATGSMTNGLSFGGPFDP
jgi:hypothetical protein